MRALIFTFSLLIYSVISEEFESGFSNIDNELDAHSFFGFVESPLENEEMARIINGEEAEDSAKRPYMAWVKAIDKDDVTVRRCGGVILSTTVILTAAQCLWVHGKRPGGNPARVEVIVGDIDYNADGAVAIEAKEWKIHPEFNWNILNNDIALINLTKAIPYSRYAWNITLPTKKQVGQLDSFAGGIATPHGWGKNYEDSDPNCPATVRKKRVPFDYVDMKVMNHTPCARKLREVYYDLPKMSNCLDTLKGDIGVCGADIGGPVVVSIPPVTFVLIGIISHYEACPTWYPNTFLYLTTKMLDWIGKNGGPKSK